MTRLTSIAAVVLAVLAARAVLAAPSDGQATNSKVCPKNPKDQQRLV